MGRVLLGDSTLNIDTNNNFVGNFPIRTNTFVGNNLGSQSQFAGIYGLILLSITFFMHCNIIPMHLDLTMHHMFISHTNITTYINSFNCNFLQACHHWPNNRVPTSWF